MMNDLLSVCQTLGRTSDVWCAQTKKKCNRAPITPRRARQQSRCALARFASALLRLPHRVITVVSEGTTFKPFQHQLDSLLSHCERHRSDLQGHFPLRVLSSPRNVNEGRGIIQGAPKVEFIFTLSVFHISNSSLLQDKRILIGKWPPIITSPPPTRDDNHIITC